jgi:hypothetical protein
MTMPIGIALTAAFAVSLGSAALAADHHRDAKRGLRHVFAAAQVAPAPVPTFGTGRLVMHPALNIACNTRGRGSQSAPCDQPVWVYGSPCEIDEGEGFFRNCGEPPGVGAYDRWRSEYGR